MWPVVGRSLTSHQVKEAVEAALRPGSAAAESAVRWMHEFQDDSARLEDKCTALLHLISEPAADADAAPLSPQYKLFALNSLEKLIKVGWYSATPDFREGMKGSLEALVVDATLPGVSFLNHGLSCCVVEVMLREWPQKWPRLLPLLLTHSRRTAVLHVLWRLAEQVGAQLRPKNAQRRREILNSISENMNTILVYVWDCMQSSDDRLCLTSLNTLTAYLEWTPVDAQLLRFLCHILALPSQEENKLLTQSKMIACDCLTSIVSRKRMKTPESEAILVLFSEEVLSILCSLLRQVVGLLQLCFSC